ncbi:VOC family protein [Paenibacillus thailandensis]|uniref:VOC family protein n=1 Tax=Paenibacillus thailandensis TaxID=393250 RepID=A0ABW5QUS7_9BACL
MLERIDRVILPVRDVASAARWYVETFRCSILSQSATEALLKVGEGETHLALVSDESGRALGYLDSEGHVPSFNFYTHWEHLHQAWLSLQGVRTTEIMRTSYMNVNEFYDPDGNVVGLCHEKESSLFYTPSEEEVPPLVHRVLAVFLPVLNLEASIAWYTRMLGFELIHHWGQGADLKVGSGETVVTMIVMNEEIHRQVIEKSAGSPYFSLQTSDIERVYGSLCNVGAVTGKRQPREGCFEAVSPEGLVFIIRERHYEFAGLPRYG